MNTIKNTAKYVSEKAQAVEKQASCEIHKKIAKDPSLPLDTRIHAAFEVVGDKIEQHGHESKAKYHKEAAKH